MASFSIVFKKSVYKDMSSIPPKDNRSILEAIRYLSENPKPVQTKKLSGDEKFRLRCGNYRILYEINDTEVVICIVKVGHRKDIYR